MKIITYPSTAAENRIKAIISRRLEFKQKDVKTVQRILDDVKKNGDKALVSYIRQYDSPGLGIGKLKVTSDEFKDAQKHVDRSFLRTLTHAINQIESFHRKQVRQSWIDTDREGTLLGQLISPVDAAGVYVPGARGGMTPLVSSVLMGLIPARIAGVGEVFVATPAMKNGNVNPYLLVAASKAGADAVYKMGSAWAIGAFAYGTETIPKVDVIVGPGNIYVTLAKKIVTGTVGIDMIAGPSEVLVIADGKANPDYIAADLLSQAEHDPLASAILITESAEMASAVKTAIEEQLETLSRKDIAKASLLKYGAIIVVEDIAAGINISNQIAPEHLELQVEDPFNHIGKIRNAGAIFLGSYSPEPIGDYIAGPNHVLPTAGTARFSSALSVDHFVKKSSLIHYSKAAFEREAPAVIRLAGIEGLDAHARSIKIRLEKK